ncbi:malonyl-ACP O-methyltransferase BioC [Celerinatantimonas yamalensis]|uniref:Malonyl-[acyl-carrier protein] O-methyltransferase n=1 Tax=Celerinatantimonas yamalensis TaxID=559956 RepID=A0ABW9G7F7_9GAMM
MVITDSKAAIARHFSQAAAHYQQHAQLQRISGQTLLAYASSKSVALCLDLGCGSGQFLSALTDNSEDVIGLDLSAAMLKQSRMHRQSVKLLQGDAEQLPLQSGCVSRIFSNLALQWCGDLSAALSECYRVLQPSGQLLFSTLTCGTLDELAQSFAQVDDHVHIRPFLTLAQIQRASQSSPWCTCQLTPQPVVLAYANGIDVLRELKGFGANYLHQRRPGLMTPRQLAVMEHYYREHFSNAKGQLLASYQIIYGVLSK